MFDELNVHPLTIYLARPVARKDELVDSSKRLAHYLLKIGEHTDGELFVQSPKGRPPAWAGFFDGHLEEGKFGQNSATAAVLLVYVRQKWFALTFGNGRFLLNSDCWEERFGLKVALNCIGEGLVRSIDKRSLDPLLRHTREQTSRDAKPREFGIDVEQDLLRAVTGKPTEPKIYGKLISGAESVHLNIPSHINALPELLENLSDRFVDVSYKKTFPWIDQIREVVNPELIDELDDLLVKQILSKQTERIWMAVPELISWERVQGFSFPTQKQSPIHHDILLDDFVESAGAITTHTLNTRRVVCLDADYVVLHRWSARRCLHAEVDHKKESYLLSSGNWYRVSADFVADVNAAYDRIGDFEGELPEFNDSSEGDYLRRVAESQPTRFALMHQQNIVYGGGRSQIEFCDLFTDEGDILHVKRYGQSGALSYAFAQGLASGQPFQTDSKFRAEVNRKLPETHRMKNPEGRPSRDHYRVVFAIICDRPGKLKVPFFSRLNLKHAAQLLEAFGFRVAKAKIEVNEQLRKTSKFKTRKRA